MSELRDLQGSTGRRSRLTHMARIALDAMGGDNAPAETVAGAVAAAEAGVEVVLVGDREAVEAELGRHGRLLEVIHAPETIGMGEDPIRGIREKPDASVVVCSRLVKEGAADGMVSAGSTGAAMTAATVLIGRLPGVLRPTIASVFPTPGTPTVLLDSGANPEVKPEHLLQFALMGAIFSDVYFGNRRPRVGLLNIGEEPSKGRALERQTYPLLADSSLDFVGNVEGRVVAGDGCDVIVTDGFTGNVFLKTAEGAAALATSVVLEALSDLPPEVASEVWPRLARIEEQMDYETYGGAHLLGVSGVVVIAHGSSTRKSITNALRMAAEGAEKDLPGQIAARIARG